VSIAVHIPQFEGPLGLLLFLIRKEEMDIFDIDIHMITSQYLAYIKKMKQFDLEVAGDFIAMAATLLQIKSRMLLPNYNEEGEEEEIEDPRKELVAKLVEYQRFQEASKKIYERPLLGRDVYRRGKHGEIISTEDEEIIVDEGGLFALIGLYRGAIRKMSKAIHKVARKTMSIAQRILQIKDQLVVGQRVVMRELMEAMEKQKMDVLVTFLSCLELAKMGFVSVYQAEVYGDIYLTALKSIEGNVVERVEEYDSHDADQVADSLMVEAAMANEVEDVQEFADKDMEIVAATDDEIMAAENELDIDGELS
jgi:segregation and condensation protein A